MAIFVVLYSGIFMKVAIVHDWLNGMRGGEKVLEALLELYPDSTIYTLFHERGKVSARIAAQPIVTSWLDRVPGIYRNYRRLLPLFPSAVRSLDVRGVDLVISSSHAVAKNIRCEGALHICYCHTPMRYLWDAETDYALSGLQRMAFKTVRARLRRWDVECSKRVDYFIANSVFVGERIQRYYYRDAAVIHPPVDTRFFKPSKETSRADFYLAAGALVPYKRVDVILQAFNKIGKRLLVAGTGPELKRLRRIAGREIEFLGGVSDSELRSLYRSARGFVFAARDDFGIMPVEAIACGCPVVAFAGGGALETVQEGVSGVFFESQTVTALVQAIERVEAKSWPVEQVISGVEKFSRETFKTKIKQFIDTKVSEAAITAATEHT